MLPSELHFAVCTHPSVLLISVLCVSAVPSGIRDRLCPETWQTTVHGIITGLMVALLPCGSFVLSLCEWVQGSPLSWWRTKQLLGSLWSHRVWSPEKIHIFIFGGKDIGNFTWDLHGRKGKEREEILTPCLARTGLFILDPCLDRQPRGQGYLSACVGCCSIWLQKAIKSACPWRQSSSGSSWEPEVILQAIWGHF